jgi:hypothetical protein
MADGSQTIEPGKSAPAAEPSYLTAHPDSGIRERIDHILDRVTIPANRFCLKGDSYDTLQSADQLMEFLAAIDSAAAGECEFEMPPSGQFMMNLLRDTVRDAVRYAAEVNDLQLTLHTHAATGGLEKFIAMFNLDKESAGVANAKN